MRRIWLFLLMSLVAACARTAPVSDAVSAADFALHTLDGKEVRLSDYRGKTVFVNFWATWCIPCRDEMPLLERAQRELSGKVVVLGINMREEDAVVREFVERTAVTYPILMHPTDQVSVDYAIYGLPVTVVVGPDGALVKRINGALSWDMIQSLIS